MSNMPVRHHAIILDDYFTIRKERMTGDNSDIRYTEATLAWVERVMLANRLSQRALTCLGEYAYLLQEPDDERPPYMTYRSAHRMTVELSIEEIDHGDVWEYTRFRAVYAPTAQALSMALDFLEHKLKEDLAAKNSWVTDESITDMYDYENEPEAVRIWGLVDVYCRMFHNGRYFEQLGDRMIELWTLAISHGLPHSELLEEYQDQLIQLIQHRYGCTNHEMAAREAQRLVDLKKQK